LRDCGAQESKTPAQGVDDGKATADARNQAGKVLELES
jgi:hypothetical protein